MLKIAIDQVDSAQATAADDAESVDVPQLLEAWHEAKSLELTAQSKRAEIEGKLAKALEAPEQGQKSYRLGAWRVTRTNKLNFSGNAERLQELATLLELASLTKPSINETAVKNLRKESRDDFDLLVAEGALKVSVGKPHFEVVRVAAAETVTT